MYRAEEDSVGEDSDDDMMDYKDDVELTVRLPSWTHDTIHENYAKYLTFYGQTIVQLHSFQRRKRRRRKRVFKVSLYFVPVKPSVTNV